MLRTVAAFSASECLAAAQAVLASEAEAIRQAGERLDGGFVRAVEILAETDGAAIVVGVGKSGLIGQKLVATLASTGTPAHFLHPAEAVHGDLGRIGPQDAVVALSHSGESQELVRLLPALRERLAPLVALTGRAGSTLARAADAAIVYGNVEEACPLRLAPSSSCAAMLALGDALAFALMKERGFGVADFQSRHPSGALGQSTAPVTDVMRVGRELRSASARLTVRAALVATHRSGRRTGAILLTEDDGRLAGILTDGDIARLLGADAPDGLERPVREVMTRRPLALRVGQRVFDAVELLRQRRVNQLPVLDADDRPVGIVDGADLMGLLPELAEAA